MRLSQVACSIAIIVGVLILWLGVYFNKISCSRKTALSIYCVLILIVCNGLVGLGLYLPTTSSATASQPQVRHMLTVFHLHLEGAIVGALLMLIISGDLNMFVTSFRNRNKESKNE
jgi:hypothetical protein